jgi:putative membrane protein
MLALVAALLPGFELSGFWGALLGSLLVSLVGTALSWTVGPKGRYEILAVRKKS